MVLKFIWGDNNFNFSLYKLMLDIKGDAVGNGRIVLKHRKARVVVIFFRLIKLRKSFR